MRHYKFEDWCHNAVHDIGFPPDRDQVYRELYGHMEDHYDALRARGTEPAEAEKQVFEAMGDAFAVGRQLARIHRPFWGYFLRVSRWLLAIALVFTLIPAGKHLLEYYDVYTGPNHGYDIYDAASYGGDTGRELLMLQDPDITFKDSGYTYNVHKALIWKNSNGKAFLYLRMTVSTPLPWAVFPDWDNEPLNAMYAMDSRGMRYSSQIERYLGIDEDYPATVCVTGGQTSPFSNEYTVWVNDLDLSLDWVEFIYDRDGRDHTIRIWLPGGVGT